MPLTDSVKATFKDAARKLTGAQKRAFTAQVALDYCEGSARKTERAMGWGRVSVQRGLEALASGEPYQDNYGARGRKPIEALLPSLADDIHDLLEGHTQVDPKLQTSFQYTRVSARVVRAALIAQKGYPDEGLPEHQALYPTLETLAIDLDGGSATRSNRTQFIKRMVEFARHSGLRFQLIYYLPYHSKYNPIERCWAALEQFWNGAI